MSDGADTRGRGLRALGRELWLEGWLSRRSFRAEDFDLPVLLEHKRASVSVVLPARDVEGTLGEILDGLLPLEAAGLIDEILVVVGAASIDPTARVALERGVTVRLDSELMPHVGPPGGKGDAMWRGLSASSGDIVLYLDTDTEDFDPRFAIGVLGPLLTNPQVRFAKGAYRRPFKAGGVVLPHAGGRVTELLARPLLNLLAPELAGFSQPLAGEIAAHRSLLESIPFPVGYGVEIAMLIDVLEEVGIDGMAQVDLGTRQNRHQELRELTPMAYTILVTALRRLQGEHGIDSLDPGLVALPADGGFDVREVSFAERPPLRALRLQDAPL